MTNIIKVKFFKGCFAAGREYTYYTPEPVMVGDVVDVETKMGTVRAMVSQIDSTTPAACWKARPGSGSSPGSVSRSTGKGSERRPPMRSSTPLTRPRPRSRKNRKRGKNPGNRPRFHTPKSWRPTMKSAPASAKSFR